MFNTYLSTFYHIIFLMIFVFSWIIDSFIFLSLGLIIYTGILLLFRKSTSSYLEDTAFKKGVVFAPVNGKVGRVLKNVSLPDSQNKWSEIEIIINPWNETGIYLPTSVEIQDFSLSGNKPHFRYFPRQKKADTTKPLKDDFEKLCLTIRDHAENLIKLVFIRCYIGGRPEIFVMPGDRGKQQANIGHFPFGGTLLLYLPDKYEILINEMERLTAGETLLAGLKTNEIEESPQL